VSVTIVLTIKGVLRLVNLFVSFSYSIINFLSDGVFETIKALIAVMGLTTVELTHGIDLCLKLLAEHAELVLEPGPERLQRVIDTLLFSFREVTVSLNLARDVLELSLELLLRLDTLHEHDIVVTVHLDKLVVHGSQRHVLILLAPITCHVLLDQLLLGGRHPRLHHVTASRNKSIRSLRFHHLKF